MHTMQSTLLVGSADWNPALLPKEEFRSRLEQMWRWCDPWSGGAIVYGSRSSHTELAYLTNFTPKLECALALIPNPGEPRLLVGGGVNMIAAARPLTWVEDVAPLRSPGKMVAEWVRNLAVPTRVLMIGGDAMPHAMHREIVDALGREVILQDAGDRMSLPMMHKSARELAAIRMACATLDAATATLAEARRSGAGVTAAILAAERAAYRRGAQDVRSLFSLDHGRTLRPFTAQVEQRIDPLQVYLAVRQAGYWAEGFVVLADQPNPALDAARAGLRAALAQAQAGTSYGNLATALVHSTGSRNPHPLLAEIKRRRRAGSPAMSWSRSGVTSPPPRFWQSPNA
jgi:hypothetical protein